MTIEKTGPRARRYEYLDLLRLACAFAVLIFHYDAIAPRTGLAPAASSQIPMFSAYGFLGVQVFFMISGFVIALSITGRSVQSFVWARMLRLYPAYWIGACLTAISIVLFSIDNPTLWQPGLAGFLVNLTMLGGFIGVPYVDPVYWTLTVELRFYVMVALLALIGLRINSPSVIGGWLALCVVGIFVPIVHKIVMGEYAPYFLVGVLALTLRDERRRWLNASMLLVGLALACRLIWQQQIVLRGVEGHPPYDPLVACVVVAAGLAMVVACAFAPSPSQRWTGGLRTLGAMTYPLYLIHGVLGMQMLFLLAPALGSVAAALVVTSIVIVLTLLVTLWLEPGLRNLMKRLGERVVSTLNANPRSRRAMSLTESFGRAHILRAD